MSPPIEDRDLGFAEMLAELRKIGDKQITVGVHGNEDSNLVKIATIHEFGSRAWKPSWKQAYYMALLIVLRRHPAAGESLGGRRMRVPTKAHPDGELMTKKERVFRIAQVLHKRTLRIPERSFLRAPFDAARDKIQAAADRAVGQVLDSKMDADEALQQLAVGFLEPLFQKALLRAEPPNAPLTIALKKSSRPLVDSGRLRQSIRAVVGESKAGGEP